MSNQPVGYLNVFMGAEGICEYDGGSQIFVSRDDIRRIELAHGFASERPMTQFAVGIVFLAASAYMLSGVVSWLIYGSELPIMGRALLLPVFPTLLGGWMVWTALRKRTYLSIETGKGRRKIILRGPVEMIALQDFLEQAGREHGYVVTSTLSGVGGT
jgi:hypothetical protein